MIDNILSSKLYRPGSVAYVSRSGGMSNELNNIISRMTNGVYEGVAIGGDRWVWWVHYYGMDMSYEYIQRCWGGKYNRFLYRATTFIAVDLAKVCINVDYFLLVISYLLPSHVSRYPGTSFMDHVIRYHNNPTVKMIVVLGEVQLKMHNYSLSNIRKHVHTHTALFTGSHKKQLSVPFFCFWVHCSFSRAL